MEFKGFSKDATDEEFMQQIYELGQEAKKEMEGVTSDDFIQDPIQCNKLTAIYDFMERYTKEWGGTVKMSELDPIKSWSGYITAKTPQFDLALSMLSEFKELIQSTSCFTVEPSEDDDSMVAVYFTVPNIFKFKDEE